MNNKKYKVTGYCNKVKGTIEQLKYEAILGYSAYQRFQKMTNKEKARYLRAHEVTISDYIISQAGQIKNIKVQEIEEEE